MTGPAGERSRGFRRHAKPDAADRASGAGEPETSAGREPGNAADRRSGADPRRAGTDATNGGRADKQAKKTKSGGAGRNAEGGGRRSGYREDGPARRDRQGRRAERGDRRESGQGAPARNGRSDSADRTGTGAGRTGRADSGREGGSPVPGRRDPGRNRRGPAADSGGPRVSTGGDRRGPVADSERARASRGGDRRGGDRSGRRADDTRRSDAQPAASNTGRRSDSGRARPGRGESRVHSKRVADPARTVALETLRAVRERDAYANLVLPAFLREYSVQGRDAALATELGYGACRSLGVLDAVIAECAGREIADIDGSLLDILRLGTYQLLRTRVEPHAAVHTSVEFARTESGSGRAGFVNAVLRRVTDRSPADWVARLAPPDPIGRLAFEYAHPEWIAQAFADALGADAGELGDLLAADDARPVVHLVARPGDITAEELALVTGGEEGRWSPYAVYLEGGDPGQLEPVREGMAAVQDEGSQLVALALTRAPLHGSDTGRWLDLCAGPGGKTALLGALAAIDGYRIDAVEPAAHRAELVRSATRGLPVEVHIVDGRDSGLPGGYDRILVDAPCTGLGALRRRPEARWRRTPGDVADLVTLQRELVTAAWDLLRPGGVLVYSTCSPHLPETVAVVADTVRRTGAEQLDARDLLPGVTGLGAGPTAQLWPHRHGTDAMFVAALRKAL